MLVDAFRRGDRIWAKISLTLQLIQGFHVLTEIHWVPPSLHTFIMTWAEKEERTWWHSQLRWWRWWWCGREGPVRLPAGSQTLLCFVQNTVASAHVNVELVLITSCHFHMAVCSFPKQTRLDHFGLNLGHSHKFIFMTASPFRRSQQVTDSPNCNSEVEDH